MVRRPQNREILDFQSHLPNCNFPSIKRDENICIIDTEATFVIDTVEVRDAPEYLYVYGVAVYVANFESDTISVIDSDTKSVKNLLGFDIEN